MNCHAQKSEKVKSQLATIMMMTLSIVCIGLPSMRACTAGVSEFLSVSASMLAVREGGGDGLPSVPPRAVGTGSGVPLSSWGAGVGVLSISCAR